MLRRILAAAGAAGSNARMQYKRVASSIASPHNNGLLFLSCSTSCSSSSRLVVRKHHQQLLLLRNSITSVGDGMPCCLSASIRCNSFSTKSVCTIHFNDLGFDVRFSLPVCVAARPQEDLRSPSSDSVRVLRPASSSSSSMIPICLDSLFYVLQTFLNSCGYRHMCVCSFTINSHSHFLDQGGRALA